jgi:cytochrome c oxidase subunit 3
MAHAKPNHDYHLVDPSPWPFAAAVSALVSAVGLIMWMKSMRIGAVADGPLKTEGMAIGPLVFGVGMIALIYVAWAWWADVVKEAETGAHSPVVQLHLRYGMILFIASEVMFFVAWFWAFFDVALFPNNPVQFERTAVIGGKWPPVGVTVIDPFGLPLLNTLILLTSGTTLTWAHHALLHDDRPAVKKGLMATIALALTFSAIQIYEYAHAPFPFKNSIYGSTFYMATGFHGFHVFIGTIFLIVCLVRINRGQMSSKQHLGFEFAAWYWHFVDVVWLFLYACIYVWGSWGGVYAAH